MDYIAEAGGFVSFYLHCVADQFNFVDAGEVNCAAMWIPVHKGDGFFASQRI